MPAKGRAAKSKKKVKKKAGWNVRQSWWNILGASYGGPAMGFEDGYYILYLWYGAPSYIHILAKAKTIGFLFHEFIKNREVYGEDCADWPNLGDE